MKHKNTQPSYIFNKENPHNSEPQNGPRKGLDFIALVFRALGIYNFGVGDQVDKTTKGNFM
jgi:hypothetical protein